MHKGCAALAVTERRAELTIGDIESITRRIEKQTALSFFSVAGTMMIGGIVASISLLFIRALITQYDGISEAGIFNVAWVICVVYPTVILSSFLTYYLPRLSQTKDLDGRCNLMNKVFKLTTILMVPMELLTIVLKPLMIDVLYSDEFQPSLNVLRWMIVGAYFRATAQVFSMPMLSSVDMKTYFWTGSLQYVGIAAFAVLSIVHFGGLELIGVGYVVIQGAFTIYALHYARSRHGYSADSRTTYAWFIGLVLIVAASLLTWQDTCVDAAVALLFIVGGLSYMALSITREERAKVHNLLVQTLLSKR
jgi:O-antigen/teichoic acid export membrane protein